MRKVSQNYIMPGVIIHRPSGPVKVTGDNMGMFQCEYKDARIARYGIAGFKELDLRVIQNMAHNGDAPDRIQLNWNNAVLWRDWMTYPNGSCLAESGFQPAVR